MCIAIYRPANKFIDKDTLQTCFDNNNDGCGFAYTHDNKIEIQKYMMFDEFYTDYHECEVKYPDSNFIIHFRITSHGTTELFNCHPFKIDDNHVFIHNGIISNVPTDSRKSDTQMFNETILQKLPAGWVENEAIQKLISDFIGNSKLIVMDNTGQVTIFNSKKGVWVDECWYSNTSYKQHKIPPIGTTSYNYYDYSGCYYPTFEKPTISTSIKDKELCALCNVEEDTISMVKITGGEYICYDCLESFEEDDDEPIFEYMNIEIKETTSNE